MRRAVSWELFGDYLRQIREVRGISQVSLADQLGCTRSYLWRLEHGKRYPSKIFLHLIKEKFLLTPKQQVLLAAFEQLIEYRCSTYEIEDEFAS